jgi:hypothetical protein
MVPPRRRALEERSVKSGDPASGLWLRQASGMIPTLGSPPRLDNSAVLSARIRIAWKQMPGFQMPGSESEIPSQSGHNYQGVNVYGKAQLGNTYHFGVFVPPVAVRGDADWQ